MRFSQRNTTISVKIYILYSAIGEGKEILFIIVTLWSSRFQAKQNAGRMDNHWLAFNHSCSSANYLSMLLYVFDTNHLDHTYPRALGVWGCGVVTARNTFNNRVKNCTDCVILCFKVWKYIMLTCQRCLVYYYNNIQNIKYYQEKFKVYTCLQIKVCNSINHGKHVFNIKLFWK